MKYFLLGEFASIFESEGEKSWGSREEGNERDPNGWKKKQKKGRWKGKIKLRITQNISYEMIIFK